MLGWLCLAAALILYILLLCTIRIDNHDTSMTIGSAVVCTLIFILSRWAFRLDKYEMTMVKRLIGDYLQLRKLCRLGYGKRLKEFSLVHEKLKTGLTGMSTLVVMPSQVRAMSSPGGYEPAKDPKYSHCAFYVWLELRNLARAQQDAETEIQFSTRDTTRPDSDSEKKTKLKEALDKAIETAKKFALIDGTDTSIVRMCFHSSGPGKIWVS